MALLSIIERGVWSLCRIHLAMAMTFNSPYPVSTSSVAVMMQQGHS